MKIAALVVVVLGLIVGIYSLAVVVSEYKDVNSEWMRSAPSYGSSSFASDDLADKHERLDRKRDDLRKESQNLALATVALGFVGIVLGVIGRKGKGPKLAIVIVGGVLCFVLMGVMQASGNIF